MDTFVQGGYPYELAGLIYYAFFLVMSRSRNAARYSRRSRILTLVAAIVLVASVPFHYANAGAAHVIMLALAAAALVSTLADRRRPPSPH
jgi:hypothetical protein